MKIALLRVGIDKICGGIHSPIFKDGTYEFIPIPEYYYRNHAFESKKMPTYSTEKGKKGKPFINYFKAEGKDKEQHKDCPIHADPDFETFTYGDGNYTKNALVNLNKGDLLVFYASMEGYDFEKEAGMYLFGYFEVDHALLAVEQDQYELLAEDFAKNFHVKNKEIFDRDIQNPKNKGLKLVKGTENSRLFKYAYSISRMLPSEAKKDAVHVISDEMLQIFGNFGGKIAIQKNPIRWITNKKLAEQTAKWLKTLE
ncbi:MAG: hypothetical protein EAZ53_16945 [Bacteroidetes bacterium]|nr:MAG: hypothetical protein EAZ53_16945 [Bacteroidota bacterium]